MRLKDRFPIDPEAQLEREILPRRLDRVRFTAVGIVGFFQDDGRSRLQKFLVDHADPQTEQATQAVEELKRTIELEQQYLGGK